MLFVFTNNGIVIGCTRFTHKVFRIIHSSSVCLSAMSDLPSLSCGCGKLSENISCNMDDKFLISDGAPNRSIGMSLGFVCFGSLFFFITLRET